MRLSLRSSRYAVAALGAAFVLAGALAASAPAQASPRGRAGGPEVIRGLGPLARQLPAGPSSQLFGVFCASPANCWAVGETSNKGVQLNEILHWTGRGWFKVAVPSPGGTRAEDSSELFAVRCTSASDCLAVGGTQTGKNAELDQALHWNGRKWRVVPTPTPGGVLPGDMNVLFDVTCTSARSCWAAGTYGAIMPTMSGLIEVALNQVLHWNGTSWSLVTVPNPSGSAVDHVNDLLAVRCASATDCFTAGTFGTVLSTGRSTLRNEILHWTGRKWLKQTVPNPVGTAQNSFDEINSLVCASPANCGAVGTAGNLTGTLSTSELLNEALHWNGKKWLVQKVPNPGGGAAESDNQLFGVTCPLPRSCWAVGGAGSLGSGPPTLNEMLHWNGAKWSSFKVPNPAGPGMDASNILNAVRCTSAANCWAVGLSAKPNQTDQNQFLHWTGRKWFVG